VACTRDRCLDGACRHDPEPLACDDANACTRDACHPEKGCLNPPDREGQVCDDRNACTVGDVCGNGLCVGGAVSCDDGDPCTVDTCDPVQAACAHDPAAEGMACDDGDPCTTGDACSAGACLGGPDGCECRVDADCAAKDDGDRCNGVLACVLSACVVDPETVVTCDPSGDSSCRKAVCEVATGACLALALHEGQPCAPVEPCATAGACEAGACAPTAWVPCNDDNACTADACDPATGACSNVPVDEGAPCDDGDLCTSSDLCDATGACVGGQATTCSDANPCTLDLCKPSTGGCVFAAIADGEACDDANPCTAGESCHGGACGAAVAVIGCCLGDADCPSPGACRSVTCGPAHTCDVTVQPDCCGNGLVEADEACDPGGDLVPGACSGACAYQAFDLPLDVAGSVLGAVATAWTSQGGYRVALTLGGADAPADDGVLLVDFAAGGQRLGTALRLAPAPARAVGVSVQPKLGPLLVSYMSDEVTEVVWVEAPDRIRAQAVRGASTLVAWPEELNTTLDFLVTDVDLEDPAPARGAAVRFVPGDDPCPVLAVTAPIVPDPDAVTAPGYAPGLAPLAMTLLRVDGSMVAKPTPYLSTTIDDDSGTEPKALWLWTDVASLEVTNPAFVHLGVYDDLVSVRHLDALTDHPRVEVVRRFFWDSHAAVGVDQVLWSVEGTAFYPFAPGVVEGVDATYALAVFPLQTVPAVDAPPLGLVRVTYDDQVIGPVPILPEKTGISARHELVRLGPDRIAVVYDVLEAPDGFEDLSTIRLGLAYAVIDDEGQTVAAPTTLLAPEPRRLPTFTALARPDGGFVVIFVERVAGTGRLRARFEVPLVP